MQQQHQRRRLRLSIFQVVLLSVSFLTEIFAVQASRPQCWGIISSWKGWHSRRRQQQHIETTSSVHHPQHPLNNSTTLNYTAITILHVGNDESNSNAVDAERYSSSMNVMIPQPGCSLQYRIIADETRLSSDDKENNQETIASSSSSWGSKWMPGSSNTSMSRAWRAQSGTAAADHQKDSFLALAQAAALTSHVVVLVLLRHKSTTTSLNPSIVQALQAGFARRHEHAGLAKGSLVIVLKDGPYADSEQGAEWRNDLVMDALQDVQPRLVYALELTSAEDYASTLNNLVRERLVEPGHFDSLVPLQAFPQLLQQTYQALLKYDSQQQQNTTAVASSLFDRDAGNTPCTSEQDSSLTSTLLLPTQVDSIQNSGSRATPASKNITTTTAMKTPANTTAGENIVDDPVVVSPTASVNNNNIITPTTVPEVQPSNVVVTDTSAVLENDEQEQAAKVLLATCHERLDALEQQLEQVWFDATRENDDDDDDDNDNVGVGDVSLNDDIDDSLSSPSLSSPAILPPRSRDFAKTATLVLQDLQLAYSTTGGMLSNNKPLQDSVTANVGQRLSRLYQLYLQSLRDYHGKVYESLLDTHVNQAEKKRGGPWWCRRCPFSRKRRRPSAARVEKDLQRTVQGFRKAAQDAVPELARRGNPFRNMDLDYVDALQGLLADMQEAISLRESLVDLEDNNDDRDDDVDDAKRGGGLWGLIRRGRQQGAAATWYEKLAARAFVLSVNYVQGWLAWQALQRAALEREREMPKFPIF